MLGSSVRRRRGRARGRTSRAPRLGGGWKKWTAGAGPRSWIRWSAVWVGLGALGFGVGYFVATEVVFPAPPPPRDTVVVPMLWGQTLEGAQASLAELGLVVGGVDYLQHPGVAQGKVIGQSPLPGQLALRGDSVVLVLSSGARRRPIPDVTRLTADRAVKVLEGAGFSVRVDSVESDLPRGRVLTTNPPPGGQASLPQEVRLTVSLGPALVEVPLLLGLPQEEAAAILEEVGLVVGGVETRFRFGRDQGLVVEQDPPALTYVPKGSAVRLVVGGRGPWLGGGGLSRNGPER